MNKLLVCLFLVGNVCTAHATSFNCKAAKSPDEKTVCGDTVLGLLDSEMSQKYKKIINKLSGKEKDSAIDGQTGWIAERKDCKRNVYCLRKLYVERINELDKALKK